ncbi:12547_t:CDS:2 [Entrophospora sp. SA101]|nr:12547_t:CDS:2 [Entrophospora sp. SA101]
MNYDIKQINDPIHGYMEFDDWAIEVIDTPEFQRLRNLKQLGTTYFVYPGASHNRFEHCLGVGHLSNKLLKQLYKNQPELKSGSFESDLKCVTLAGLCHDLGHGPFSHVFDNRVIPKLKLGHEEGSVKMFDHLIDENHIDLNPEEVKLIKSLITGKDPSRNKSENSGREFLFDIVANKRNSIDVDKFDYLERDCYNIGIKSSYDSSRLMKFSRVIDDQICYSHKESHNIYELFHTRYSLHKKVYQHPMLINLATAIDHMLADALVMANDVFKFSESIFDPNLMALNRSDFHEEDIIVHKHKINYSKKSDNPVDSVKFYKKHCDKDRNETSYLAPEQFEEVVIRIYTKKPDQLGKIQNAFRDLIKKHYSITTASTDYSSGYGSVSIS